MPQPKNQSDEEKAAARAERAEARAREESHQDEPGVKPVEHTEEQSVSEVIEQPTTEPREAVEPKEANVSRMKFSKERLIRDGASLTGVPGHVLAGALASSDKDEFTIDEAKQQAEDWLASPVKEA